MSNLKQYSTTLENLENEVSKLSEVTVAYQKFRDLSLIFDDICEKIKLNVENQNELKKKIDSSLSEIAVSFDEKTNSIRKENKEFYLELENTLKLKLNDHKSEIKQLIESERNQIKQIFEIEFAKSTKELKQEIVENIKQLKISVWVIGIVLIFLSVLSVIRLFS
jgi:hypothetical protein